MTPVHFVKKILPISPYSDFTFFENRELLIIITYTSKL